MDPNELLKSLIELATELLDHETPDPASVTDLAAKVLDLNDWFERGGFLPYAWQHRRQAFRNTLIWSLENATSEELRNLRRNHVENDQPLPQGVTFALLTETLNEKEQKEIDEFEDETGLSYQPDGPPIHSCEHCGELLQFWADHDCDGVRAESAAAKAFEDAAYGRDDY